MTIEIRKTIGDLRIGKVDGKEEFFLDGVDDPDFRDFFLMPENVRFSDFSSREVYFITGFRGTGKTSLLRYVISQLQGKEKYRSIALFKSDLPEENRMSISNHSGAILSDYDPQKWAYLKISNQRGRGFFLTSSAGSFEIHQIAAKSMKALKNFCV